MKHFNIRYFKDLFLLCKAHHSKVALTTRVFHSVMDRIRGVRIGTIVSWNNYLLWWFAIHPARPHLDFPSKLSESCHFIFEVCVLIPEETIVPQIAHQLCRLLQPRVVRDPHLILL